MNLFVVHKDPRKAARMLCDQHHRKMFIESAQMLSSIHRVFDGEKKWVHRSVRNGIFWDLLYETNEENEIDLKKPKMGWEYIHPDKWANEFLYSRGGGWYKNGIVKWTALNRSNYDWHYQHFDELLEERKRRYGSYPVTKLTDTFLKNPPKNIPNGNLTKPFLATGNIQPTKNDPVVAYREFYCMAKDHFATWKKPGALKPKWYDKTMKRLIEQGYIA